MVDGLPLTRLLRIDLMRAVYAHDYFGQTTAKLSAVLGVGLCPEFVAVALHRFASRLMPTPFRIFGWVCYLASRYLTGTDVSPFATIGPGFRIAHAHGVVIGAQVVAGSDLTVFNGTNLGARLAGGAPTDADGMPRLGDRVFIGAGARVLGRIALGDDVLVAANAVVIRDVASGTTVAGIPAKPLHG